MADYSFLKPLFGADGSTALNFDQFSATLDAQNPDAKAMKYLSQGINGEFAIIRTDDKLITTDSRILSAIMEATP